jgi:hypothetical protein
MPSMSYAMLQFPLHVLISNFFDCRSFYERLSGCSLIAEFGEKFGEDFAHLCQMLVDGTRNVAGPIDMAQIGKSISYFLNFYSQFANTVLLLKLKPCMIVDSMETSQSFFMHFRNITSSSSMK